MIPILSAGSIAEMGTFSNWRVICRSYTQAYSTGSGGSRTKGRHSSVFKENEDFKMICDDYRLCSEALKGWNQSESEEAPARRKEYADLLQGLELEISQILNEHT